MKKRFFINQLRNDADQCLGGLNADEHMRLEILKKAGNAGETQGSRSGGSRVWLASAACACAVIIALCTFLPGSIQSIGKVIDVASLGNGEAAQSSADDTAEVYSSVVPKGRITAANHFAIKTGSTTPKYHSIWAANVGSSAPVIRVGGRFYRMMTVPSSVSDSVLGESMGQIEEYNQEPAISTTKIPMSNIVECGQDVYEISGMGKTMVAASVNGTMRAFQRTGFSGNALIGREGLDDVLHISGHIVAMELSDVGVIEDSSKCEELFSLLLEKAAYLSTSNVSGSQSLIIELDNGLAVQLAVKNDSFSCCGKWTCPEFFEEYKKTIE